MRLDNYLYFVLDYKRDEKREARVICVHKNNNLICLYRDFGSITNDLGDIALLDTITLANNKDNAYEIAGMWNKAYKDEKRYFNCWGIQYELQRNY